jgi:hypothetical protein
MKIWTSLQSDEKNMQRHKQISRAISNVCEAVPMTIGENERKFSVAGALGLSEIMGLVSTDWKLVAEVNKETVVSKRFASHEPRADW